MKVGYNQVEAEMPEYFIAHCYWKNPNRLSQFKIYWNHNSMAKNPQYFAHDLYNI